MAVVDKSKQLITSVDCINFMPAVTHKVLLAQYTPLAATELPSVLIDLAPFWAKVESAFLSLDPSFKDPTNPLMFTS